MITSKYHSVGQYIYDKCCTGDKNIFIKEIATSREVSFISFWSEIEHAVAYLHNMGVKKYNRVVLQMDNTISALAMFMACLVAKIVPVIISSQSTWREINNICKKSNANFLATTAKRCKKLSKDLPVNVLDIDGYQKMIHTKVYFDKKNCLDDIAYIVLTSGSTGVSKEVEINHSNMLTEIESMSEAYGISRFIRHLCILPIYHASGLYRNILMPFHVGAEVVLLEKFEKDVFWYIIKEEQINFTQIVPSIMRSLLSDDCSFIPGQQSSLKFIGSASAPHPLELIKSFEKKFGIYVLIGYGMTEATCGITLNALSRKDRRLGSVGKPISVNRVEIWCENGKRLPLKKEGRVIVYGANVARNIHCNYLDSGDYGYMEEDGYLWLTGRRDDLIKRSGYRISPDEIENTISACFPNLESVVIGVTHPVLGQDIIAFVVNKKKENVSSLGIIRKIKGKLSSYKIPSEIFFIDEMPRLGIGKVDKKKLLFSYNKIKGIKSEEK